MNIQKSTLYGIISTILLFMSNIQIEAQTNYPSANPKMIIITNEGESEETSFSGSAPVLAKFSSNSSDLGNYTGYYEWRIYDAGKEENPKIVRYDEDMEYTFLTSGATYIKLLVTYVNGNDTIIYEMDEPFSISISESKLEMPNAFSPNGDGQNDIYKAKEGHQSIVKFHAYIFNRWGHKLYEWTDINGGWDGKSGGSDMPVGVYYCLVEAQGADGKKYNIRKDVNLLRGYSESNTSTGN